MLNAACLVGTVLLTSRLADSPALAVYSLSFWHYLFYWWAYRYGAVRPARFRRDAMVTKCLALLALGSVYLVQPWHWIPALTIGSGFALNLAAARVLGHARTYYGLELGEVPPARVTGFPYSLVPHPMLVGNIVAFSGTLLHPDFRRAWWPLAVLHVAMNGALIVMETSVASKRRPGPIDALATRRDEHRLVGSQPYAWAAAVGATLVLTGLAAWAWPAAWIPVAIVAAASAAYGYAQRGWYVPAASPDATALVHRSTHESIDGSHSTGHLRSPLR